MATVDADPESLSRIELVSSYLGEYPSLDEERKARFEAEFARRGLPLPDLSAAPRASRGARRPSGPGKGIDKETLLSYILLIYTGTAIFYAWYYLIERLIRRDFRAGGRHRIIQTALATFYAVVDILALSLLAGLD